MKIEQIVPETRFGTLYPAGMITATVEDMQRFFQLHIRDDEQGPCYVAQLLVQGVGFQLYMSQLTMCEGEKHDWTMFFDMPGCVKAGLPPIALATQFLEQLTDGALEYSWTQPDVDSVFESKRDDYVYALHRSVR